MTSAARGARHLPIYPADVGGRFSRARKLVFAILFFNLALLPHLRLHGLPALAIDLPARRFLVLGTAFNAQDTYLVFFVLSGLGFGLVFLTAVLGRAFCGWTCPQTVLLEGLFRPIERLIDGPRNARLRRATERWTFSRVLRATVKHALYVGAALLVARGVLDLFVLPGRLPWLVGIAAVLYGDFAWFRERVCAQVCPYGRLQGALVDDDSLLVAYDARRGEPRGKKLAGTSDGERGDCVDCARCVTVCPAGIDIREGLQLECIACTACIDACDDVMTRLGRPTGLVRYDSLRGLSGLPRRALRPRVVLYSALLVLGASVAVAAQRARVDIGAAVSHLPGAPYTFAAGEVHNAFDLHLVNKSARARSFTVAVHPAAELQAVVAEPTLSLPPWGDAHVPVFCTLPIARPRTPVTVTLSVRADDAAQVEVSAPFLGVAP